MMAMRGMEVRHCVCYLCSEDYYYCYIVQSAKHVKHWNTVVRPHSTSMFVYTKDYSIEDHYLSNNQIRR